MRRGWTEVSLGEICEFKYGKSLPNAKRSGGKIPVFGSNGVVGRHDQAITNGPTIIIGRKGSYGEVNFSLTACWPIDTTYYIDSSATKEDLRWLAYRLPALGMTKLNRAAAIPGLNREDAYRQRLLLPPLAEQKRIAAILDKADAIRRKRQQAIKLADDFLRATFLDIFGDPVTNPKGWEVKSFGDIASKFSDGPFGSNLKSSHYVGSGVRVVRLQNIGTGRFIDNDKAFISEDHFNSLKKHKCLPGDVLIGTLGDPNLRACLLPSYIEKALNKADCIQFTPKSNQATSEYVLSLINQPGLIALASHLLHGQTRTRISMGTLRELLIPVPPLYLQEKFTQIYNQTNKLVSQNNKAFTEKEMLFNSLTHRAYQGEL